MKAAEFDYVRATSIDEICDLLDESGDHKIIAGGQTLVPLMAMRLARPALLIDIADVTELRFIRVDGDRLCIGAATRQVDCRAQRAAARAPAAARQGAALGRPIRRPATAARSAAASRRPIRRPRSRWLP
ncbi:MAG: FAD binding domain-containing protein [Pseudomonadota bacterium]